MPKKPSTKAEKLHMIAIQALGCIPCSIDGMENSGDHIMIHHAKRYAGDQRCHSRVVGMCYAHHQGGPVSRHDHNVDEFKEKYGDDVSLLKIVKKLL